MLRRRSDGHESLFDTDAHADGQMPPRLRARCARDGDDEAIVRDRAAAHAVASGRDAPAPDDNFHSIWHRQRRAMKFRREDEQLIRRARAIQSIDGVARASVDDKRSLEIQMAENDFRPPMLFDETGGGAISLRLAQECAAGDERPDRIAAIRAARAKEPGIDGSQRAVPRGERANRLQPDRRIERMSQAQFRPLQIDTQQIDHQRLRRFSPTHDPRMLDARRDSLKLFEAGGSS